MSDLLSAISILLVFITFLLKIIDEEISSIIKESKPFSDKPKEIKNFRNRLYSLLFLKAIPITFIYLATAYSILPKTIYLILHGKIDLWNFDPLNTIFIFIECGTIGLATYAAYKTFKLISKIRTIK